MYPFAQIDPYSPNIQWLAPKGSTLTQPQQVQRVAAVEISETLQPWNPEDLAELRQSVTALQQILSQLAEPKAEDEGEETPENSQ